MTWNWSEAFGEHGGWDPLLVILLDGTMENSNESFTSLKESSSVARCNRSSLPRLRTQNCVSYQYN